MAMFRIHTSCMCAKCIASIGFENAIVSAMKKDLSAEQENELFIELKKQEKIIYGYQDGS
jgi:hypothetical protein